MDTMVKSKKKKTEQKREESSQFPDASDLPIPANLPAKFKKFLERAARPDMRVVMNFYSGDMKIIRSQNVFQAEKGLQENYKGEIISAPGAWFVLTDAERRFLFPLFINWLYFDWVAINSQARHDDFVKIVEELGDTPDNIKEIDDLRFVTDPGLRTKYEKVLNAKLVMEEEGIGFKEAREAADAYKRPSFVSPSDALSLDFYARAERGYLEKYARIREVKRREKMIVDREQLLMSEELVRERARAKARKQVQGQE